MVDLRKLALYAGALTTLPVVACLPFNAKWFPDQYHPYGASTQAEAVYCVSQAAQAAKLTIGAEWRRFLYDTDRFWKGRYKYLTRQRSEPAYLGTYDEVTVDVLRNGMLRFSASAWHRYGNPWQGFHNEDKAPGPAAYRFVEYVKERCGS